MTCEELVELVTAYLDGALPVDQTAAFDEHLGLCPGCETYLAQFRQTIEVLGALSAESLSPEARDDLLTAFSTWQGTTGPGPA